MIDAENRTIEPGATVIAEDGMRFMAKDFRSPRSGLLEIILLDDQNREKSVWAEETMRRSYKLSGYRLAS